MKENFINNRYEKCANISKETCYMGSHQCGTCAYCLDTTGNGWKGDGDYYCLRSVKSDAEKSN